MPEGETQDRLEVLISRLSRKLLTPVFLPHVTLIGEIEIPEEEMIAKTTKLAKDVLPLDLVLGACDKGQDYYHHLFLQIEPSQHLNNAYDSACRIFRRGKPEPYQPHLSLVYGDLGADVQAGLAEDIGDSQYGLFRASTLYLYKTYGAVSEWSCLCAINRDEAAEDINES